MLRSKHFVGLILAATLIATLVPFSTMVYAQNQDEKFKEIAEQAKEKVDELGAHIGEALSITWPGDFPEDIQTAYSDASSDLAAGDCKDAMKSYREVFEMLNIYAEEQELFEGAETEESETLTDAITRASGRISKVRNIINEHYDNEYLTDDAKHMLDELLDTADELLDEAPEDPTKLGEANKLISQAFVSLKKHVSGALHSGRTKGFLTVITKFLDRIDGLVESANEQGLIEDRYNELTDTGGELEAIRDLIEEAGEEGTSPEEAIANLLEARLRLESIQTEILELRKGESEG